ncbi:MAG: PQQ-binding-like beta-propeller repeat protein [Kiritimatiellia bacterium]|nr:PQQ-binding-like beta-propeller repeat protein [Kiritimatiellia bacterium]MDP7022759.1 PQQ-binding-like beta-propeller repeat protein [Kiritimatiellia bacterium]
MAESKRHVWRRATTAALTLGVLLSAGMASAAFVTFGLEAASTGETVAIEQQQSLWLSPFGGYGVSTWPFSMYVGDVPLLKYRTADELLRARAMNGGLGGSLGGGMGEMLGGAMGEKDINLSGRAVLSLDREVSEMIELDPGEYTIRPFGIKLTIAEGGALSSSDARVRIDPKAKRASVVCHPVTLKFQAGTRSVAAPLKLTCDGIDLLRDFDKVIEEYNSKGGQMALVTEEGFRLITLYLPASAPGASYDANDVQFTVDPRGQVRLGDGASARVEGENKLVLAVVEKHTGSARAAETRPLGVSWFGLDKDAKISCGKASASAGAGSGAAWLPISSGASSVMLGKLNARVPAPSESLPNQQLVWDAGKGVVWAVQSAPLAGKPGGPWSCSIKTVVGRGSAPASFSVRVEPLSGGGSTGLTAGSSAGSMKLRGSGGKYSGTLPTKAGLWALRVAFKGGALPLDHTVGMVRIGGSDTAPVVSFFNFRNRGIALRGDVLDVLWRADLPAGSAAAQWTVVLRGSGVAAKIAKVSAAKTASGAIKLDTQSLAPGDYTLGIEDVGLICYPMRFRVVQTEPESDFEICSFEPVVEPSDPYPGSPIRYYKNSSMDGGLKGPGMRPFWPAADGALDAALASYAGNAGGPPQEKFMVPGAYEKNLMALAAMGMRHRPAYPEIFNQEGYNPKHSLPEDLEQMRRRMALTVQPLADVPGLGGFVLGWHGKVWGFWEDQAKLDGRSGRRSNAANEWAGERFGKLKERFGSDALPEAQKKELDRWLGARAWGEILPNAYAEWFADARRMLPDLTLHNTKPTGWGQGNVEYPPITHKGLSHREGMDYSDYCIQAWQNFLITPMLAMGNQAKQKVSMSFMSHPGTRAEEFPILFGSAGRGADSLSMSGPSTGESESLLRIFSRFGSWFTALDPLPDVAIYFNDNGGIRPALHDLARLRRPGMVVSPEDVLAGELSKYKVLMLLGVNAFEHPKIEKAIKAFEASGGIIVKDKACAEGTPGQPLDLVYAKQNHGAWHLASDGEWPFLVMWQQFKGTTEKILEPVFARTPQLPVTTPDATVVIAPLAGKESILCFVINQTLVPEEIKGRWRQYVVLPKVGELLVDKGWHIHNVLTGKAAKPSSTGGKQSVAVDFRRKEGALFLLTKREPKKMSIRTERTAANKVQLTGWLADAKSKPLADPMPFEVTLRGPDGVALFHKMAALGPSQPLDVPVPAMSAGGKLTLTVQDLILGSTAVQELDPAPVAALSARATPDLVGGAAEIKGFLEKRKGPVTVILDDDQGMFKPVAEKMAALLKKAGRQVRVETWDLTEIRPLPMRWTPTSEDQEILKRVKEDHAWAWQVKLHPYSAEEYGFKDPRSGYSEIGPALRHDADVVFFGTPENHRAVAQVEPYLRRQVGAGYPAAGGFFVHYLYSPFHATHDGLYIGCHDAAGAEAGVDALAALVVPKPAALPEIDAKPVVTAGGAPAPLEDMVSGKFGTQILDASFSPSGNRFFLTTSSYGDWLYVFDKSGELVEKRIPPNVPNFPNWYQWARSVQPLSEEKLVITLCTGKYIYDLKRGYIGKAAGQPSHGLPGAPGGHGPTVKGSTRLEDPKSGNIYLGGNDVVTAMDKQGRFLWRFCDGEKSGDFAFSRGMFTRAVSGDGSVLLVSAMGIKQAQHGTGLRNPSVLGLDTATGKLLWQRKGVFLSEGKATALDDRFMVADDNGKSYAIMARTGRDVERMGGTTGIPDHMLSLPARRSVLIVENTYSRDTGPDARVTIQTVDGKRSRKLAVPGAVSDARMAPDGKSFALTTRNGHALSFSIDGVLRWDSPISGGGFTRFSPDGTVLVIASSDGVVQFLNAADGALLNRSDLNPDNVISPEQFVKQAIMPGNLPREAMGRVVLPLEPSYLKSLKKVPFGPNLMPADAVRKQLQPTTVSVTGATKPGYIGTLSGTIEETIKVEKGKTYLVELLNAVANPAQHKPVLRFEVAVTPVARQVVGNLPYRAWLPLDPDLARWRAAFRADKSGTVKLTMRAVKLESKTIGTGRSAKTKQSAVSADVPVLLGDVVVAALDFGAPSLIYDGGAGASSQPAGTLKCTVYPWQSGNNEQDTSPRDNPKAALQMVNGRIANRNTAWSGASGTESATVDIRLKKPKELAAVVIYEDSSGPVVAGNRVRERAMLRYELSPLGVVSENRQLVNIFECPSKPMRSLKLTYGGRQDFRSGQVTDGQIRTAQIELYAPAGAIDMEDILNIKKDDGFPDIGF